MELTAGSLYASLLVSVVGFGFFHFGRKQGRIPQLVGGLLLMVYPYFIGNVLWMLVVGALLLGGIWLAVRAGY